MSADCFSNGFAEEMSSYEFLIEREKLFWNGLRDTLFGEPYCFFDHFFQKATVIIPAKGVKIWLRKKNRKKSQKERIENEEQQSDQRPPGPGCNGQV